MVSSDIGKNIVRMEFPESLIYKLLNSCHVVVLTGAGISAESNVPTFRDAQSGLWARYKPEELATPEAFERQPNLVWEWYTWRRQLIDRAIPNPGHHAIIAMQHHLELQGSKFILITQNVDGLHQRAGSRDVLELHGNIHRNKCSKEGIVVNCREDTTEYPPRCPRCGGLLRPDVVWFGEIIPPSILDKALHSARQCDVFLSIGTSTLVHPAASLLFIALEQGATVLEINPNQTPLSNQAHYTLMGLSGIILPALVNAIWGL
jgi:NAD-dependent deacetylase